MQIARMAVAAIAMLATGACSGDTTPVGPLGPVHDLRPLLPEGVRAHAPADEAAVERRAEVTVGEPPAKVAVKWRTFADGKGAYIASMALEVVATADGISLDGGPFGSPVNRGTVDAPMQSVGWRIVWSKAGVSGKKSGTVAGDVLADGTLHTH
jgi:hypothetical protein